MGRVAYYGEYGMDIFLILGPLVPEITVKYFAVSFIFFNSGISLKTEVNVELVA